MGKKSLIFLLIILAIAGFFRLWQLDSIPPGLYPDEAINGNDALDTLQNKDFKLFYPENNGREGLFYWLLAFSFAIFGPSIWALKFVSALFGILTVLGVYFLTKELFGKDNQNKASCLALLASFFLAISFWHVNFSRIGFRAILIPFILSFGFYFLFRGFRKQKIIDLIISGVFFGLGFYTYISYRFIVLLAIIVLILWWLIYKKQNLQKKFLLYALYLVIAAFIISLPIGIYFLLNPGDFFGRAAGVSVLNAENPIYELGKSVILHLGMFNFYGDGNWRHNLAGSPQLLWPVGIFFLLGLIISIKDLIISLRKKEYLLFAAYCLLLYWFFIMLLPGFLSAEGVPHALRVISVIPVIYIFAAIGAYWLFEKIKVFYKTKRKLLIFYILACVFLLSITYAQFNKYFYLWAKNPETENAFSKNYVELGNYLNSLPDNLQKYVIVNQPGVPVPWPDGIPMPAQTLMFIERTIYGQPRAVYLLPKDLNQIKIEKQAEIIFMSPDPDSILEVLLMFPDGTLQEINKFWIYKTNKPVNLFEPENQESDCATCQE